MINVSSNSWHYKLIESASLQHPTSLCKYVRTLMYIAFVLAIGIVACLLLLVGMVYDATIVLTGLTVPASGSFWHLFHIAGIFGWIFATVSGLGVGSYFAQDKYQSWKYKRTFTDAGKPEPSLLSSWLKAKKNKVCPLINYVSE